MPHLEDLLPCPSWDGSGIHISYLYISAESVDQLKLFFTGKLERHYSRCRLQEIGNLKKHPNLRTYIVFKDKLDAETYISCIFLKHFQRAIIRVSSQRLCIELGRHQKPCIHGTENMQILQFRGNRWRISFSYPLWIPHPSSSLLPFARKYGWFW